MNQLDYIILGVLLFAFWRGWSKGLVRSLLGPLALGVCVVYAYWYYQRSGNVIISIGITILGPMVVYILFLLLHTILKKAAGSDRDEETPLEIIGRLCGALLSMTWMIFSVGLSLVVFMMIPLQIPVITSARQVVAGSGSMRVIQAVMGRRLISLRNDGKITAAASKENRSVMVQLEQTAEYTALMQDARIKALLDDPDVMAKIKNKDFISLMQDPKLHSLMQDGELIKKILSLNQKMMALEQTQDQPNEAR